MKKYSVWVKVAIEEYDQVTDSHRDVASDDEGETFYTITSAQADEMKAGVFDTVKEALAMKDKINKLVYGGVDEEAEREWSSLS